MAILDRVRSTRDLEHSYFNLLVYGPPGSGKTYMARTAVEAGHNVLLLDADHGTMTLRDQDVPTLPITQFDELLEIYKELREGEHGYDTVFIDNLTEIQKLLIDQLKHEHGRRFGLHSWAKVVEKTSAVCRAYRSLPMNVVILAHSMEIEDENRVRVRPALSGKKLPHEISGLFDLVGYSHTAMDGYGNMSYRVGFATAGDRHVTKDRSGRLEAVETNDFGLLYRKVFPEASREMHGKLLARTSRPLAHAVQRPALVANIAAGQALNAETLAGGDPLQGFDPMATRQPPRPSGPRERRTPSAPIPVPPPRPAAPAMTTPPTAAAPLQTTPPAVAPGVRAAPIPVSSPLPTSPEAHQALRAAHPPRPAPVPSAHPGQRPIRPETAPVVPAVSPLAVEGAYGTEAWRVAMERFRATLATLSNGDRGRVDAICNYVKLTQEVSSSTQMSARALHAWAERLEFMATNGALDDYL